MGMLISSTNHSNSVLPHRYSIVLQAQDKAQVIQPLNGDPFIGMLETPVTSAPIVANYLSNLPAYRTGVAPLLRGVEIGLAHGFFLPACLSIYGAVSFQRKEIVSAKTLSGRDIAPDEWQTSTGWGKFTSGWVVGGLSGVLYCYLCTQF